MGLMITEGLSVFMLVLFLGANAALFAVTFLYYDRDDAFAYTRLMLGSGLAWARASALCVNLNCMVILLPVSRNLVSLLRSSYACKCKALRRQLNKTATFHRVVGCLLAFHSGVHVIAHLSNIESYHESQSTEAEEILLKLSSLGDRLNESYLNPIRTYNTTPVKEVLVSMSGVSGLIITVVLVLVVTSSTEVVRRTSYEVFWFTHHSFIVFLVGLAVHGSGGIVRGQTPESLLSHNVSYCHEHLEEWGDVAKCPLPHFRGSSPAAWKWIMAPVLLYVWDRVVRFRRSLQPVSVTKVVSHPLNVVELQMKKPGFRMESGQYVLLQCPAIAPLEWHPFTLTSAPEEDHFSVHVRVAGDWTAALHALYTHPGQDAKSAPGLAVDGPFGSASSDVFRYRVSMCIAAGIGVTPFASILKSLWYKSSVPGKAMKLQKLYFLWLCRDTTSFEWFQDLLVSLETDTMSLVSFHIYLTSWDDAQARHIALNGDAHRDVVTGLRQKTSFGRPNWDREFQNIATTHPGSSIGVFLCGPKALSKVVRSTCAGHSSLDPRGAHFHFNEERF